MDLIDRLQAAVKTRNVDKLPELEKEAKAEFARLDVAGQKNYVAVASALLDQLRKINKVEPRTVTLTDEQRKELFGR